MSSKIDSDIDNEDSSNDDVNSASESSAKEDSDAERVTSKVKQISMILISTVLNFSRKFVMNLAQCPLKI